MPPPRLASTWIAVLAARRRWISLRLQLVCPESWQVAQRGDRRARLALCWWADAVELWADGALVHQGDLFDSACRWVLPSPWWEGQPLQLELRLRSPLHDDGALIHSRLEQEPTDPADPSGVLAAEALSLGASRLAGDALAALQPELEEGALPNVLALMAQARPRAVSISWATPTWIWPGSGRWRIPGRRRFAPSIRP